jgi:octaprenyl-diphosphate synthase
MLLTNLKASVQPELNEVDKLIISSLHSDIPLVEQIGQHIIRGGGKRIRPLLLLIVARACGYNGKRHLTMATVIEFIHTATLLHDDVVDKSTLRRGSDTANSVWGNEAAVLVGDFLYSRAFQLMVKVNDMRVLEIIADATNTIAQGEVLQLLNQNCTQTTEQNYLTVIRSKTAKLFEAATEIAAILGNATPHIRSAMAQFGLHLGTAYQLIDDLLDYQAPVVALGKEPGQDLAEGKPTMPLIYIFQNGTEQQKATVIAALTSPQAGDLSKVQDILQTSGAYKYTIEFARREAMLAKQALCELADSEYKEAALELAEYVITRDH